MTIRDGVVVDITVSDESAIKTRPGNTGYVGLFGLDLQGSSLSIKGSLVAWARDDFNQNNNPAIILNNYNGSVMII